jgi:predicted nucleic acid-binding Zn ribbon protein
MWKGSLGLRCGCCDQPVRPFLPSQPPRVKEGLTLSTEETPPVASPDGVRAPARGGVLASRLCPVCRKVPIHTRQEVCSGRCRAARSRQRKAEARRERDGEIRALLEVALKKLQEGVP